jgi:hypothetical protein
MAADIRFQTTPNPNAGKFSADRPLVAVKASRSFYSPAQAAGDPLAELLFRLDGVVSLFMVEDFVTVTKKPDADWRLLAPQVVDTMQRALG